MSASVISRIRDCRGKSISPPFCGAADVGSDPLAFDAEVLIGSLVWSFGTHEPLFRLAASSFAVIELFALSMFGSVCRLDAAIIAAEAFMPI